MANRAWNAGVKMRRAPACWGWNYADAEDELLA
jgi:hypothetical protein